MKTTTVEVIARNPKQRACWLRVQDKHGFKILTMPDDVIPYGMKTATHLRVKLGPIRSEEVGYQADIEVLEDVSDEQDRSWQTECD